MHPRSGPRCPISVSTPTAASTTVPALLLLLPLLPLSAVVPTRARATRWMACPLLTTTPFTAPQTSTSSPRPFPPLFRLPTRPCPWTGSPPRPPPARAAPQPPATSLALPILVSPSMTASAPSSAAPMPRSPMPRPRPRRPRTRTRRRVPSPARAPATCSSSSSSNSSSNRPGSVPSPPGPTRAAPRRQPTQPPSIRPSRIPLQTASGSRALLPRLRTTPAPARGSPLRPCHARNSRQRSPASASASLSSRSATTGPSSR